MRFMPFQTSDILNIESLRFVSNTICSVPENHRISELRMLAVRCLSLPFSRRGILLHEIAHAPVEWNFMFKTLFLTLKSASVF